MNRPTLLVQTVHFDASDTSSARRLGIDLYDTLTRPLHDRLAIGAGIPVRVAVAAERVDLESADCVTIVAVVGKVTFFDQCDDVLRTIANWRERAPTSRILVVPTAPVWRNAEKRLVEIGLGGVVLLSELYPETDEHKTTLREIILWLARSFEQNHARPTLFLSHAQADEESTEKAAEKIRVHVANDSISRAFFEKIRFFAGEPLDQQTDHSLQPGVLIGLRSDTYGSRVWCQRELLTAKLSRLPTLIVEVLRRGELRSSPYGGNSPTILWNVNPEQVVARAMVEWLRAVHFYAEAERLKIAAHLPSDTLVLARPPELLDLAQGPLRKEQPQLVLHPDPELSVTECQVLRAAHSRLHLVTPTTLFRRVLSHDKQASNAPLHGMQVAMSLANSPDVDGPEGFTSHHVDDATIQLARSLIAAGAAIAYGGDFRAHGFATLLSELIVAYNQTAAQPADFLHSYLAAPIRREDAPENLPFRFHHLRHSPRIRAMAMVPFQEGAEPLPLALYDSDMRRVMAQQTHARVLLGGAATPRLVEHGPGYRGRYPGVVEEAWRTVEAQKPLYVVGGFGGGAALVAQLLAGKPVPPALRDETWTTSEYYRDHITKIDRSSYRVALGLPESMEALAVGIRTAGSKWLSSSEQALAWNGLTVDENQLLFRTLHPQQIASLIMKGLLAVSRKQNEGRLEIQLVHGNVTQATDLDALAVAVFDNIPLGGAGAALDQSIGLLASAARKEGHALISIRDSHLGADWLYLASLGELGTVEHLPRKIAEAAQSTARVAIRYGLRKVGVVAFGGSILANTATVVQAMVRGLGELVAFGSITWFESDESRFEQIFQTLQALENVKVTPRRIPSTLTIPVEPEKKLILHVAYESGELAASMLPPEGNGIAISQRVGVSEEDIQKLCEGSGRSKRSTPDLETLETRGRGLAELLLGEQFETIFRRLHEAKMVVVHDIAASRLPFEAMLVADGRTSLTSGLNRRLAVKGIPVEHLFARPPKREKFNLLLVVNPTEDLAGTQVEQQAIENVCREQQAHVTMKVLQRDQATKAKLLECLPATDVLHYAGHAFFDGPGDTQSGLMLAGHERLTLSDLRNVEMPRIAFVNACEGARVRAGSDEDCFRAASFAEIFLRSGVEAFLGTMWRVKDKAAADFAGHVYAQLALGATLDEAVCAARAVLLSTKQSDWANYVLYGDGRFRLVEPTSSAS